MDQEASTPYLDEKMRAFKRAGISTPNRVGTVIRMHLERMLKPFAKPPAYTPRYNCRGECLNPKKESK